MNERSPSEPLDPSVAESPYAGLSGVELLSEMQANRLKGVTQVNKKYGEAICRLADAKYPDEILHGDVEEIWKRRCQALGIDPERG